MLNTKAKSSISPIFRKAKNRHAIIRNSFCFGIFSFAILFCTGVYLRINEYNDIKDIAKQDWYKNNGFLNSFMVNNINKEPVNVLLSFWTLIISIVIVIAFIDTKNVNTSNITRAFSTFTLLMSFTLVLLTGYLSPDMFHQTDFLFSLIMIIFSIFLSSFTLISNYQQQTSIHIILENEMTRTDHLYEYQSLSKQNRLIQAISRVSNATRNFLNSLPETVKIINKVLYAIFRFFLGLLVMFISAMAITYVIALLLTKWDNHPSPYFSALLMAVLLALLFCLVIRFAESLIGVNGPNNKRNQVHHFNRLVIKCLCIIFAIVVCWLVSAYPFYLAIRPSSMLSYIAALIMPILPPVYFMLFNWNWAFEPVKRWYLKKIIMTDERAVESIHYSSSASMASSYFASESSVDGHLERLFHTVIKNVKSEDWMKVCYSLSDDLVTVPLLSLSTQKLLNALDTGGSELTSYKNTDTPKRQQTIERLLKVIGTNDSHYDCCNEEDCKIYLAAIFGDRQYLSTTISSRSTNEKKPESIRTTDGVPMIRKLISALLKK